MGVTFYFAQGLRYVETSLTCPSCGKSKLVKDRMDSTLDGFVQCLKCGYKTKLEEETNK